MINNKKLHRMIPIIIILASCLFLSSCSVKDKTADPSEWGYDCTVTYDALGGTINSREIRETYYMKNSYIFKPSGSTNMLIEPVKDRFILVGWYTTKEDIKDANGNVTGHIFKSEDRWDFDEDRVQNDMTLYARWIPQGKIDYIDASTDEVMFSKNITEESAVQELSSAVEMLIAKSGYSFEGYYSDKNLRVPYDFTEYVHVALIPTNEEIYEQVQKKFPNYVNKVKYVEPADVEASAEQDTSDLFINKLGYEIATADVEIRTAIRKYKDELYENAINFYEENSSSKAIYLKYIEGGYANITKVDDLKSGGKIWFSGLDKLGNPVDGYIISNDIDFAGVSLTMAETFSGKIIGNGYSLKNITFNVSSKKIDNDISKSAGLFKELDGAYIENLTFEDMTVKLNVKSGIPVFVGTLAIQANNTDLKNVHFESLTIDTGRGDDGTATYKIGDVFLTDENNKLENVTGSNVTITASETAQVNVLLGQ
ncbi:MAG TPA: InlB B-repeat-containing protein [Clostridiales bacterium]|nr:InlB B-repeat-containing protein [Clostridiales bacterium]